MYRSYTNNGNNNSYNNNNKKKLVNSVPFKTVITCVFEMLYCGFRVEYSHAEDLLIISIVLLVYLLLKVHLNELKNRIQEKENDKNA